MNINVRSPFISWSRDDREGTETEINHFIANSSTTDIHTVRYIYIIYSYQIITVGRVISN